MKTHRQTGPGRLRRRERYAALLIALTVAAGATSCAGAAAPRSLLASAPVVTSAAPPGVFFGWKNFLVKDHPMMSPEQTMARSPQPVMISYQ